jgi:hypothetical protein
MKRFTGIGCLRVLALLVCHTGTFAQPQLVATRVSESIRLDGRLDELAWKSAQSVVLTQQSPRPGAPTPYQTTVKVVVFRDTVFFGFECVDPEPNRIAIHTMQRDGDFEGDDSVSLVLDTYGDRRTGYFFQVNAAGARADGMIASAENPSFDWDGLWDARTARTPSGWSAEIGIPVVSTR